MYTIYGIIGQQLKTFVKAIFAERILIKITKWQKKLNLIVKISNH
jgi:hypothetical protein